MQDVLLAKLHWTCLHVVTNKWVIAYWKSGLPGKCMYLSGHSPQHRLHCTACAKVE